MFTVSIADAQTYLLILARIAGIIFSAPIFESRAIPTQVKIGFSAVFAFLMFPLIGYRFNGTTVPLLGVAMMMEAAIGLVLGLGSRIIFSAVEVAGQLVGSEMGLSIVSLIDPVSQTRSSVIAQFQNMIAMLLFFTLDMHHLFLQAVAASYQLVPIGGFTISEPLLVLFTKLTMEMFVLSLKIGAPVMAIDLFVSVGLGVVARTVPQMNVFMVGFPLKIGVGLLALGLSAPFWSALFRQTFITMGTYMSALLKAM